MFLILFVDGFPVKFLVQKSESAYSFLPVENPYGKAAPVCTAFKKDDDWSIYGTDDQNLIDQIVEDLNVYNCQLSD